MMRGPGPTAMLERAIAASARAHGVTVTFDATATTAWESATFSGARHVLEGRAAAVEAVRPWLAHLPEAEFRLRGHLVADLAVTADAFAGTARFFTIEALTVVSP